MRFEEQRLIPRGESLDEFRKKVRLLPSRDQPECDFVFLF